MVDADELAVIGTNFMEMARGKVERVMHSRECLQGLTVHHDRNGENVYQGDLVVILDMVSEYAEWWCVIDSLAPVNRICLYLYMSPNQNLLTVQHDVVQRFQRPNKSWN